MNTVDTPEVSTLEGAVPAQNMVLVPLSRLRSRPSKRNVRRKARTSIAALAASIRRLGLLQNLTVISSGDHWDFEVVTGGRRLAALKLLAKKRHIAEDWPVPCLLVADTLARTASLAENVQREAMGPVDELRAWKALPNRTEAKRIAKLEGKQNELQDRLDDEDAELSDDGVRAIHEELDRLGSELEAIEQTLMVYSPGAVEMAGAVVSVDHMGGVVVHRGLLREEQAKALRAQERQEADAAGGERSGRGGDAAESAKPSISERLAKRLSARRTAALQAEVARHPHLALVAMVHRLALRVVFDSYGSGGSPIDIIVTPQDRLALHAPDVADSPAAVGMGEVREAWAARLPKEPKTLFAELLVLPQGELLSLLAVCVASTVSVLASREDEVPAAGLAEAVSLDMHDWWNPTAEGYFAHVSKAKALEAVLAFAPDHLTRLSKLKKAEIASEAERLAAGTGWLPVMFRGRAEPIPETPTSSGIEAVLEADEAVAEAKDREHMATDA